MSFIQNLDNAASVAVCSYLSNGGNAALGTAVVAGLAVPGAQVPSLAAGLGLLALNYGCTFDPTKAPPPTVDTGYCKESAGALVSFNHYRENGSIAWFTRDLTRINSVSIGNAPDDQDNDRYVVSGTDMAGSFTRYSVVWMPGDYFKVTTSNGKCTDFSQPTVPAPQPPVTYTGGDAECNINVEFVSWLVEEDGNVRPVLKMSSGVQLLASGGVIGGCNFEPVIYAAPPGGGGGEPPWFAPWAPGPDGPGGEPWWYSLLRGAAAGAVGAIVGELLDKLFPKKLPGVLYRLTSVCEVNANGDPISQAVERSIPEMETFAALDARLGAIVDIAQGLKDFKQPVCAPERFRQTGDLVSVNFQSKTADVPARDRVRKEFRYRDQTNTPESAHVAHWQDFSWSTGPVCVISKGLPWGVPQVWASSENEGKRVIGHAAAAAGVDLTDPKHEWVISSSSNPRYGRQAQVYPVVCAETNKLMISKRDGPSGLPSWKRDP